MIVPKNTNLPILATIDQYAPRRRKRTSNPKSRYKMACPLPGHNDAEHADGAGSFAVNDEETLFICFGCGVGGTGYLLTPRLWTSHHVCASPCYQAWKLIELRIHLYKPQQSEFGARRPHPQCVTAHNTYG